MRGSKGAILLTESINTFVLLPYYLIKSAAIKPSPLISFSWLDYSFLQIKPARKPFIFEPLIKTVKDKTFKTFGDKDLTNEIKTEIKLLFNFCRMIALIMLYKEK
jgi:hypothetical protein